MIKAALLASALVISSPALAQTTPAGDPAAPTAPQTTPDTAPNPTPSDPTTSAPTTPAPPSTSSGTTSAPTTAAPNTDTTSTAPATGDQVSLVVDQQFPTYDKDGSGVLSAAEFGAWLTELKKASDPTPPTKTWLTQVFTLADTDKSKSVSKPEMVALLKKSAKS